MNYDENQMLEYIEYLYKGMKKYDEHFNSYVRINPKKCEANKGINAQQQNRALHRLMDTGVIKGYQDYGSYYVKIVKKMKHNQKHDSRPSIRDKPENEAVRRWKKLSLHPPVYSHNMHIRDYLDEADLKYPDPEYWEGGEDDD